MGSSITGFAELADEFEDAADALDAADVEGAIDRGIGTTGEYVVEDAQRNAPVRTGELREKISMRPRIRKLRRRVVAAADHSAPVEFGVSDHIRRPGPTNNYNEPFVHPGMPAQPFLRPALLNNRDTLTREIQSEIRQELRRAFRSR